MKEVVESEGVSSSGTSSGSEDEDDRIYEESIVKDKCGPNSIEGSPIMVCGSTAITQMSEITDSSKREIRTLTEENRKLQMQIGASSPRKKHLKMDPLTMSNIQLYVNRTVFSRVKFMKGMEMKVMQDLMENHLKIPDSVKNKFLETYMANLRNNVDEARQNVQKVARIKFFRKLKAKKCG